LSLLLAAISPHLTNPLQVNLAIDLGRERVIEISAAR